MQPAIQILLRYCLIILVVTLLLLLLPWRWGLIRYAMTCFVTGLFSIIIILPAQIFLDKIVINLLVKFDLLIRFRK